MKTLTPSSNFIAIDVEYADGEQRICQIGVAKVENDDLNRFLYEVSRKCFTE